MTDATDYRLRPWALVRLLRKPRNGVPYRVVRRGAALADVLAHFRRYFDDTAAPGLRILQQGATGRVERELPIHVAMVEVGL